MSKRKQLSTFLNLLTDYAFKKIFGQLENKKYLLSLLSAVLDEQIVDVEYNDKESLPSTKDERSRIFDIFCTTNDGRKLIVEMQNGFQEHFADRALYYVSSQLVHQSVKGKDWDYQLTPVYGIFIMNFNWNLDDDTLPKVNTNPFEKIGLYNYTTKSTFTDNARLYFLKLPFAQKTPEECDSLLEAWMYVLKNFETMNAIPAAFDKYPIFTDLGETARTAALNPTERRQYEHSLKVYRDNYAISKTDQKIGQEREKISVIRKMFNSGDSLDHISEITDKSIDQIKRILKLK